MEARGMREHVRDAKADSRAFLVTNSRVVTAIAQRFARAARPARTSRPSCMSQRAEGDLPVTAS